jgi:hypothetical protein
MTDTLTGFTTEELDLLASAVVTHISDYEGVDTPEVFHEMRALSDKIARMRLVGKKVRFLDEGTARIGVLQGYKDWEGILMAEIASKGFIYRVGVKTGLLGEA